MQRPLLLGIAIWLAGTVAIRLAGQHLLLPAQPTRTLLLYAVSAAAMAALVPQLLGGMMRIERLGAVTLLMLPTLTFDALACAFFPAVYPNVDPAAAGLFGGWMLICCGGAVAGVWLKR